MTSPSLSGLTLGPYKIQEVVGKGTFGTVYRAASDDGTVVAIKVANSQRSVNITESKDDVLSQALGVYSGGYGNIWPASFELFQLQCKRSQASPVLPRTQGPFVVAQTSFLVMEFIRGMSLRSLLNKNLQPGPGTTINDLELSIKVFDALTELENSEIGYHGDLKPDNIILSGSGVRVTDPGYFGALACAEGMIPNAVVTTPSYYPCLEPDDSFAAASILWEIVMGRHPLMGGGNPGQSTVPGAALKQWIASQELIGRYFLSPIANLLLPSLDQSPPSKQIEKLLLNALGLEFREPSTIEKISSPMKASAILKELVTLRASGVKCMNQIWPE